MRTNGQDAAFNAWYDNDHAPGLSSTPGFVSAQRAVLNDTQMLPIQDPSHYLALFRIDTFDIAAMVRKALNRRRRSTARVRLVALVRPSAR
jgi:hypothetical protein